MPLYGQCTGAGAKLSSIAFSLHELSGGRTLPTGAPGQLQSCHYCSPPPRDFRRSHRPLPPSPAPCPRLQELSQATAFTSSAPEVVADSLCSHGMLQGRM